MASVADAFRWSASEDDWRDALQRGRERVAAGLRKRDWRLSDEGRAEKVAIGILGEMAYQLWSDSTGLSYVSLAQPEEVGSPDKGDFLVGGSLVVDVKTQDVRQYFPLDDWRCEVTEEQMGRTVDLYVFGKLYRGSTGSDLDVMLVGWLEKERFLDLANYNERGSFLKGRPVRYSKWDVTIDQLEVMAALEPKTVLARWPERFRKPEPG